jgi:hypothetical protein
LESRRRKKRQWRSVQSIIGATEKRRERTGAAVGVVAGYMEISKWNEGEAMMEFIRIGEGRRGC